MKQTDDRHLLLLMKQGERSAMEEFYRRYSASLFAVCHRYIPDAEDVKDVLQDSFIKIFSSVGRFELREGGGTLKTWATRIVVNTALSHLRSQHLTFISVEEIAVDDIPDTDPGVDELSAETLQRLIEELPAGYRTVFNLFAIEQLSHKEIAKMLGISESTSSSQYLRAKRLLKQKIKSYLNG